jgi:hypothetical protein
MNFRQKVAVVILDVLIIAELCVSLYLGNQDPENLTPIFFKSFLTMVIPTLIIARVIIKRMGTPEVEFHP